MKRWLRCIPMWALAQLAAAQEPAIPFVPHTVSAPGRNPRWTYMPGESAIGWTDSGRTLVFSHATIYSGGGDVVQSRCEESGVFALDMAQRTVRKVYGYDKPPMGQDERCLFLSLGSELSLGRPGELLYGYANGENRVHALNVSNGRETGIGPRCEYRVASPRLSPDRSSVAVVWGCGHSRGSTLLATVRVDGSHLHVLALQDTAGAEDPSWSPDGQWLVFTHNDGTAAGANSHLAVVDTSGRQLRTLAAGRLPEWSPNGEWIAYESQTGSGRSLRLIRPTGAEDHVVVENHTGQWRDDAYGPFRWLPNGSAIAFSRGGVLWQFDLATGVVTQLTSVDGHPGK